MNTVNDKYYRALVMGLLTTQLWLEVQDNLKETKLYRQDIKRLLNQLEKKMEKLLGPEFTEIYSRDEEDFRVLMNRITDITEWVANAKFENVLDLGKALKENRIKFQEDEKN